MTIKVELTNGYDTWIIEIDEETKFPEYGIIRARFWYNAEAYRDGQRALLNYHGLTFTRIVKDE